MVTEWYRRETYTRPIPNLYKIHVRTLSDLYRSSRYAVEKRSVVDGFVGLPAELLGGLAVDEYIIYEVEWLFAMPLMQLIINQLVNLWVWFADVQ